MPSSRIVVRCGLTAEEYQNLLIAQNSRCAICGRHSSECRLPCRDGESYGLMADHCHKTDQIRGLICARCNRAIGLLEDRADLLERAVEYVSKPIPASNPSVVYRSKKGSEEWKRAISEALKGKSPSEEARAKMSVTALGNSNASGNALSQETRDKMSRAHTGVRRGPEINSKRYRGYFRFTKED